MSIINLAVIGLGYVGLPLATEFAKQYSVVGYDINKVRVEELREAKDMTLELEDSMLSKVLKNKNSDTKGLYITHEAAALQDANVYIITVPTPVDRYHRPDLSSVREASKTVSRYVKKGDIIVYESTVYPGVTEDICVPLLEQGSGLIYNHDFFVGYSPERINPGDKEHTVTKIKKVVSGSSPEATETIRTLYSSIIEAGTYVASSIKVAEAAKVIENAQRDINIAFMNELSKIFGLLNLDTAEVLEAAATKWNFLPFKPGLVGGHCIGVDPYYLAQKAMEVGYHPEIILAGRRLNDGMGAYIAGEVVKLMVKKQILLAGSKALLLGITFKENCSDVRNTKVIDIITELQTYHIHVEIYDPWVKPKRVKEEYGIEALEEFPDEQYDAVIVAVAHRQFTFDMVKNICRTNCVLFDVKSVFDKSESDARL